VKRTSRVRPTGTRLPDGSDDNATMFGVQLDITLEPRLFQQRLRYPDALRVADGDNAGFDSGRM
jgi:hypothetical protein